MEKTSNWKISSILVANVVITHWLVKSFGTNLLEAIIGKEKALISILDWQGTIISLVGIVVGFLYSRWYFKKKGYVIENKSRIILISTALFAVVILAINFFAYFMLSKISNMFFETEVSLLGIFLGTVFDVLILAVLFYLLSMVFIQKTQSKNDISSNI